MRNQKVILVMGLAVCAAIALMAAPAGAATEAQKDAAISAGLAHLASTQLVDGRWNYSGDNEDCAATAAALLAFAEEGHTTTSGTAYSSVVQKGINFLMSRGTFTGGGIKFVPGGNNNRDTYVTGLVIPAIVANNTPAKTVAGGALNGLTHSQIVQQTINYFEAGQNPDGGWRYYANYGASDTSTTQWPLVSMLYANQWGITPPNLATVQSKLDNWIIATQAANGGALYNVSQQVPGTNESRTGAMLLEMAFNGWDNPAHANHSKYLAALNYVDTNWLTTANNTWNGNFGHPYAMWAIYKGLELTIGLNDTTAITNLHPAGTIDPGDTWNWWEDYCEYLVNTQDLSGDPTTNPNHGRWGGYSSWPDPLSTAWAINILNATEVGGPVIPEPLTCGALLLGLGGLGGYIRKRRRA